MMDCKLFDVLDIGTKLLSTRSARRSIVGEISEFVMLRLSLSLLTYADPHPSKLGTDWVAGRGLCD